MGLGLVAFALAQVSRLALGGLGARLTPDLGLAVYVFMQIDYQLTQLGLCVFTVGAFGIVAVFQGMELLDCFDGRVAAL